MPEGDNPQYHHGLGMEIVSLCFVMERGGQSETRICRINTDICPPARKALSVGPDEGCNVGKEVFVGSSHCGSVG